MAMMTQSSAMTNPDYSDAAATALARRADELHDLAERLQVPEGAFGLINSWVHKPPRQQRNAVISPTITCSPAWSHELAQKLVPELMQLEKDPQANRYGLTGFARCLNLPGWSQDPIGFVARNEEVQNAKIDDSVFEGLKMAASVVCPIMKPHIKECGISFRKGANTGSQMFSASTVLKAKAIRNLLSNFGHFIELIEADNFAAIRREFGASTLALVRRRHQSDSVNAITDSSGNIVAVEFKERVVADGMGGFAKADKRLPPEFDERTCGNRERKVIAIDFIFNIFEVILSSLWRFVAQEFPHHWHVGNAAIELRAFPDHYRHRRPRACDVKNYDQHKPLQLLDAETDALCDAMELPDWVRKISKITNAPPLLSPPTWMDGRDGPHIMGDPDHPLQGREDRAIGLPSGKGLTAAWHGKFANGLYCFLAWCKVLKREASAENFKKYLYHSPDWPVWAWNCGDDVCFWLSNVVTAEDEQRFTEAYHSLCSCWEVAWDEHPSFLSYQIRPAEDGTGDWTALPDAARGATNCLDRETGLPQFYGKDRLPQIERWRQIFGLDNMADPEWLASSNQFGCFGFFERSKLYRAQNPAWSTVEDIILRHFESFRPGAKQALEEAAAFERSALEEISTMAQNSIDPVLLTNPHYAYFRPEYEDVVVDAERSVLFLYIPPEEATPITAAMAA